MKNLVCCLAVMCLASLTPEVADAALYAVDGANPSVGGGPTTLYQLDPTTGAVVKTIGAVGFDGVKGIAFHPMTGVLYGAVSDGGTGTQQLITIDTATGGGTLIGTTSHFISDLDFSDSGMLFGWSESTDDLVIVDISTGAATVVGESGLPTGSTGLAFDGIGRLVLKNFEPTLYDVNTSTGVPTRIADLVPPPGGNRYRNVLAYDRDSGLMYTAERSVDPPPVYVFDPTAVDPIPTTQIGLGPTNLSAMAFGPLPGAFVWGSFDSTRINYPDGTLNGSAHSTLRSILNANNGWVHPGTPELTPQYLAGVDGFYTSLLSNSTGALSGAEQTALQNWIAGGGTLVVTADIFPLAAYESFTSTYGVTAYTALSNSGVGTVLASHTITAGVSGYQYATESTFTYGMDALLLGDNGFGDDFLIVMEPETGFTAGGRIVVLGDHNMFTDSMIGNQDNTQLANNIAAWAHQIFADGFESGDTSAWSSTVQ